MKKIFAIIMCVMMVMCFMPSMAFAEGEADGTTALPEARNGVITLNSNVALTNAYVVPEDETVTIDLNEKTITRDDGCVFDVYGSLTIKNGTVQMTSGDNGCAIWLNQHAKLVVDKDATINAPDNEDFCVGFWNDCSNAEATVKGNLEGGNGLTVNGTITNQNCKVNVEDDAKIDVSGHGLYLAGYAETTIDKAIITGDITGIEIRAGKLTVDGADITGGSGETTSTSNKSGTTTKNAAIAVAQHTTKQDINVNISDGNFVGGTALSMSDPENNNPNNVNVSVTGGTFSTDPLAYVTKQDKFAYQMGSTYVVAGKGYTNGYWYFPEAEEGSKLRVGTYYPPSTPQSTDPITNHDETAASEGQTGTTPTTTADLSKDTASKTETKTEIVRNEAGQTVEKTTQTTTVALETAGKIVENALKNKSEEVVLDATTVATVATAATAEAGTQTKVVIPAVTVQQIVEKTDAAVTVKTDVAEVTLDAKATEAIAQQASEAGTPSANETVAIVVEKAKESDTEVCFELSVVTSNGKISDFEGGKVTVTVPVSKEMAAKELICVYIAEDGTVTKIPGKLNADGTYTFTTGHFSTYAIMTAEEAGKALDAQEAKLADMVKAMKLKARSAKTAKGSIKVTVTAPSKTVKALKDAGYTVKYKFYRSTKKASQYAAKLQKTTNTYINTAGKKGIRYYYKAIAKVYDEEGKLVAHTSLKNCRYACRVK